MDSKVGLPIEVVRDGETHTRRQVQISLMEAADLTKIPPTISGLVNGNYMFIIIIGCAKDFVECGTVVVLGYRDGVDFVHSIFNVN